MKRRITGLLVVLMLFVVAVPAEAEVSYEERLMDSAALLDNSEEEELRDTMEELSDTYDMDVVMMLLDDYKEEYAEYKNITNMSDPFSFIEEYYYQQSYNMDSGIIILVSMEERDWALCRFGDVQEAIDDDYGYEYITQRLQERLSDGDYYEACEAFLADLDSFMEAWEEGDAYSSSHAIKTTARVLTYFGIAIGISLVLSLILVLVMKSGMNTAKPKPAAKDYVKKDSFVLTNQQDLYLYSHTTKKEIPKESSSSGRSGGSHSGSHGGSGGRGKF